MTDAPHHQAAFINAIREDGTKAEACDWLQKTWNELCEARKALALRTPSDGEVVAWRFRVLPDGHWAFLHNMPTFHEGVEIQALYARPQGMEVKAAEAIRLAMEVLNLTILSGTKITEGHDGNHSTYTPLAERAKVAWSALSALSPGKE